MKIGDEVIFVNSYGVCFGKDIIKKTEDISYGTLGIITENTDTPWYASDISHFREPDKDSKEIVYCYITGKKIMLSKCKKCQKKHYIENSRNFRDGKITFKEIL